MQTQKLFQMRTNALSTMADANRRAKTMRVLMNAAAKQDTHCLMIRKHAKVSTWSISRLSVFKTKESLQEI